MLSDNRFWLCGLAVAFFKRNGIAIGLTNGSKEDHITHTKTFPVLWLNELNYYKTFCGSVVHHMLSCSSLLSPKSQKKYEHTRSSHFRSAYIHYTTLFWHCKHTSRLEIYTCPTVCPQSTGINVHETWLLLGKQNNQFCSFQLHNMCDCVSNKWSLTYTVHYATLHYQLDGR
jgi:hypothetical protein